MTERDFRRAVVIPTGMMGPGIAATLALGGLDTRISSRAHETARKGLRAARECILTLEKHELTGSSPSNLASNVCRKPPPSMTRFVPRTW
jgi:3-hydroxybutyryl-CoA dehydrogenase